MVDDGKIADGRNGAPSVSEAPPSSTSATPVSSAPELSSSEAPSRSEEAPAPPPRSSGSAKLPKHPKPNNVRKLRTERMMSKAELARRANLSVLTIDRVEKGFGCRMNTKRKIIEALGLSLADRVKVFGEEE